MIKDYHREGKRKHLPTNKYNRRTPEGYSN